MSGLEYTLLRPAWLLGLPVLAAFGFWLMRQEERSGDWQRVSDPALMRALAELGRFDGEAGRRSFRALLITVALVFVALSGPAVERREALSFRNLDGVLFVVDVSPSVVTHDAWPQMQSIGRFALASLGTRPGGLIAYAGDAYVAVDMTLDHLQLGQTFSLLGAETVPDAGSRPARALLLAADLLASAEVIAGDVVLMTDGAGLGPESLQAAAVIAAQGARLSLVSLEPPVPSFATHAAAGGGEVFGPDGTEALVGWLDQAARTRFLQQEIPLLYWRDLGRAMLVLALLPLLVLFRRAVP